MVNFLPGIIKITNKDKALYCQNELRIFAIPKFRFKNDNSFYPSLFLLSAVISLNPGPFSISIITGPQLFKQEEEQTFSKRVLHLIYLNINSLLPKTDELRDIAKRMKAAVIGISESKLDSTVFDPERYSDNYKILPFDRNHLGCGVACYIRSDISYKLNSFLPNEMEKITFDILMPHTCILDLQTPKSIYVSSKAIMKFTF